MEPTANTLELVFIQNRNQISVPLPKFEQTTTEFRMRNAQNKKHVRNHARVAISASNARAAHFSLLFPIEMRRPMMPTRKNLNRREFSSNSQPARGKFGRKAATHSAKRS